MDPQRPDPQGIREAAGVLRRGGLVAFPTETVYGLGANLQDPQAIQELYRVKRRPFEKKVTLHVAQKNAVESAGVRVTDLARRLIDRFWPGPLTLILSRADGSSIGFRMPDHPVALALIREAQVPVVAPSANLSGQPPPRSAESIVRDFSREIDLILDAGPTPLGMESTVLDLSGPTPKILRRGALGDRIEEFLHSP